MSVFGQRTPGQPRYSGQLHNISVTESIFGTVLPIVVGTTRVHGKMLDYNGFLVTQQAQPGGGCGIFGGKSTTADYSANVAIALAQGPIQAILSIWDQQGKLANQSGADSYTVPTGGGTIIPQTSPIIQHDLGVTQTVPYTVTANDYGSAGPVTYTGTQQVPMTAVATPATQFEYHFNPATGAYTFPGAAAGKVCYITYSSVYSLYYSTETQAAEIPLTYPYTISTRNQPYFSSDGGVRFVSTGAALTATSFPGTPGPGEYNEGVGFYTFNAADAGKYVYITYTYTSSNPNLTSASSLNLTFFNGAQGQSPWSFFVSNFPSSAFGYTGICYVGANPMDLGQTATLPNYNYEIVGRWIAPGQMDADVTQAIAGLLTDPLCGIDFPSTSLGDWSLAQAYLGANGIFISEYLTSQESVADIIKRWLDAMNIEAVNSGGLLKLVPYGDTTAVGNGFTYTPPTDPAATLTWDDLLPFTDKKTGETTDEDPIQIERTAAKDAYNYMQAEWTNRLNDYNNELTPEQNDAFITAYGRRMEGPQSWHFLTTVAAAQWALNLRLKRGLYKRNTYRFNLAYTFAALEPMDVIVLPTGEPVRIKEVADDPKGKLTLECESFSYGSGNASEYPKQQSNSFQPNLSSGIPGNTSAYLFEATPQSVLAKPNTVQIAVAGNQPAWGGCDLYVSEDGITYAKVDRISSQNRTGLLSAALALAADPDTGDTLSVDMTPSGGELTSVTDPQADLFVTLSAIIDQSGAMELVSYATANLTAQDRYDLTYLRRGVYGTTIGAHTIGAEFAYLGTTGIYEYQYPAQYAGRLLYFKFPAFNLAQAQQQSLADCKAYTFTIPGTTLQPPSTGVFSTIPASVLTAQASGATAQITIEDFTAGLNNLSVACTVAAPITGLNQDQLYYVYYVDPAFAGGAISPVATQNPADFTCKVGYYSLGSIQTPTATGTTVFRPSAYTDSGDSTTANPTYAYDANPITFASVTGIGFASNNTGICTFSGFPSNVLAAAATLTISLGALLPQEGSGGAQVILNASLDAGSTWTTLLTATTPTAQANYTLAVPIGTDISSVLVMAVANPPSDADEPIYLIIAKVYDINIQ
jgi:hypothetical protein